MSYEHKFGRLVDADAMAIYHGSTKVLQLDKGTANKIQLFGGGGTTGDDLSISANLTDLRPIITLYGNDRIVLNSASTVDIQSGGNYLSKFRHENSGGHMYLYEATDAPTAITDWGAIFAKNDNTLHFQDGAGVDHTVAFS
jgi:hypothetical protein